MNFAASIRGSRPIPFAFLKKTPLFQRTEQHLIEPVPQEPVVGGPDLAQHHRHIRRTQDAALDGGMG